ncbi:putative ABC transporter ATP-binding protein [Sporomusa sphaeroides DSM 2875]|uniref:ABC transporter ATP-binding protein n=1 Tax=Sporomusa sphaeroides DSM 2875 TaxID=1337886 RepID=A0ABP2C659_9FIRM|nr:putative ABC transporter ATP-binding protein [Sporomusa sphaeroides DSM 2875]CVK17845.1 putative ABC transporter ATP-binding protein [Sporomusa sphaeroides DSM 2875]
MFVALEAVCDLLQPTIMASIIDIGVANRDLDYVLQQGGIMLLVTAAGALAATARNIISSTVSQRVGTELRSQVYEKIQTLPFTMVDKFDRAALITRLTNDVTQIQSLVNGMMRISLKAPILCIGGLIMAVSLNPRLSVVLAGVVPVVGLLIAINMKIGYPMFLAVQSALDQMNRTVRETVSGVRVVRAFNRFSYEQTKFATVNTYFRERSETALRRMAVFGPSIALTMNLGVVAVLWLGGRGVKSGEMQVGHIIAFINYMTQILFALVIIALVFNVFVRARVSARRIEEVLNVQADGTEELAADPAPLSFRGRIDFEQVSFAYDGTLALDNISLTCLPGETVGIIGPTGAGKSTLVQLIPRLYEPAAGTVKLDGLDIHRLNPRLLRDRIAFVPQKALLFSGTILDNIRWGKEGATSAEIETAARMAQAHDFVMDFPEGYETRIGQGGVNLSGGQKQRLAIARALVRKPAILILDDATSAVDVATEARIRQALAAYAAGLTCFIIAQRISSIMTADKIAVLDEGKLVGLGQHEKLLASCAVYREICQSQLGGC